ncbi:MAG: hypothetical protein JSR21_20685 [Proteobacteria bacterium]|nr:hypothetical protein [Pseudomonadota bacterium]
MAGRLLLLLGLSVALAGCGFSPAYLPDAGNTPGVAQREMAAVHVAIIGDRAGQLLRQALQERLEKGATGVPLNYELTVSYGIAGEGIAILQDSNATRVRLVARANWSLAALDDKRTPMTHGSARAVDAYNIFSEQYFAADLENDAAAQRLAGQVADQIALQLAAYFRAHAAATAAKAS